MTIEEKIKEKTRKELEINIGNTLKDIERLIKSYGLEEKELLIYYKVKDKYKPLTSKNFIEIVHEKLIKAMLIKATDVSMERFVESMAGNF